MSQRRFKDLSERLLRAGIAPRHVRRYVNELRDHLDDLVRAEKANGLDAAAAEAAALARLGDTESLAKTMIDQPHMRSVVSRHPWAILGLGPIALAITVIIASAFIYKGIADFYRPSPDAFTQVPVTWRAVIDGWNLVLMYVMPLTVVAMAMAIGLRHRISTVWTVGGALLLVGIVSFFDIAIQWPKTPDEPTSFNFGIGFAPPYPQAMIQEGFWRLGINLAVLAMMYHLWKHRLAAQPLTED